MTIKSLACDIWPPAGEGKTSMEHPGVNPEAYMTVTGNLTAPKA